VSSRADRFREQATECEKKAEAARDLEAKRMLLEAARHWREMAAQAERRGLGGKTAAIRFPLARDPRHGYCEFFFRPVLCPGAIASPGGSR